MGTRKKFELCEKFDLADIHTMTSDCQLVNPFFGLRAKYATIRDNTEEGKESWGQTLCSA